MSKLSTGLSTYKLQPLGITHVPSERILRASLAILESTYCGGPRDSGTVDTADDKLERASKFEVDLKHTIFHLDLQLICDWSKLGSVNDRWWLRKR
jgi:predicted transcriptional regulator